ncbi:MAG: B12-binding domain-containing radical SAM protein [Candidatus Cloacimonetes bacterium]|nr:B12-binding domain-containing radical SAM protein [Candidatus Cloacimonadota bacterium]
MQKILFVAINARYVHTNLALLYLNQLTTTKAESSIAEFNISQSSYDILTAIDDYLPDIVGFSVYIWNSKLVKEILNDIKKVLPRIKVILGGPEVSYNPQEWLDSYSSIDYIITGGGEQSWQHLLDQQFDLPDKIVHQNNYSINDIPFPYSEKNIASFKDRIIYYESSRGCPYSCTYCLSSRQETSLELRDLHLVKKELAFFINQKVSLVKFVDRTFNANAEHARSIWSFLMDKKPFTRFHFEINPSLITEQDIEILQKVPSNLFQFEIGVQSTHTETLKEICRSGEWYLIKENIARLIRETSIPIHLDLIFGLPYETYDIAQKSFNEIYSLQPDHFQPGMLKVLPGTVMEEKAPTYDLVYQQDAPYRILANRWISFTELNTLQKIEHLVNNLYNSQRFTRTLQNLIKLVDSPFDLYLKLVKFWAEKNVPPWQKDWVKTATLIGGFTSSYYNSNYEFILDCLRWDLCSSSGLQYYPDFLLTPELSRIQGLWKRYLKQYLDDLCLEYEVEKKQIHRGNLFVPQTEKFQKQYLIHKNDVILFIKYPHNVVSEIIINFSKISDM